MFKNCWYPLARAGEVSTDPRRIVALGQDLVAFRQPSGAAVVMSDLCVHRGAALSQGHVDSAGSIVCPYHGWEYDGSGACILVPAQLGTDRSIPRKARVDAYPVKEAQGLVWAFLGDIPAAERPSVPEGAFAATVSIKVPASYEAVLEHALTVGEALTPTVTETSTWAVTGGDGDVTVTWHLPSTVTIEGGPTPGIIALLPVGPHETVVHASASLASVVARWRVTGGLSEKPASELSRAYRVRRNELIDQGWGIEAHRIAGDGPVAEAVVIPSPNRKEVPELARAWVLKEVPAAELPKAAV